MGRRILTALSLFLLTFISISLPVEALDLPAPRGYVNDFSQVLAPQEAGRMEALLSRLDQQTGVQMAVVTVPSLEGGNIEDEAVRLFEQWGIGKKGTDNGLLILVATGDRKARIEVGYGLEGTINDAVAGRVLRDVMFPEFKKGQFGAGLMQGVRVLVGLVEDEQGIALQEETRVSQAGRAPPEKTSPLVWIFRILLLIGAALLFIKNPFLFLLLLGGARGGFGGGGFGRGGGFGGFGGGLSGGGGASGSW